MITLKTEKDLKFMRQAGKITAGVLMMLKGFIRPGVSTADIDRVAEDFIRKHDAIPSEKGYKVYGIPNPFPSSVCASINDEVVHGIPSETRRLEEGDIISVDVMACYKGYHGDACYTYAVGDISPERRRLLDVTCESLHRGIAQARSGNTIGDIGHAVETFVMANGFGLVREYTGHGLGRKPHEAPLVPNYGKPGAGVALKTGMTIAIEPMVMAGSEDLVTGSDGWLVSTVDGSDAAHFEKTVLITDDGAEILTPWE